MKTENPENFMVIAFMVQKLLDFKILHIRFFGMRNQKITSKITLVNV